MEITKDVHMEDLVQMKPSSVLYLADRGIKCIACGEPIWGTLEDAAREKGFTDEQIVAVVIELNALTL